MAGNQLTSFPCEQDTYVTMAEALARLLERMDEEEGLSNDRHIYDDFTEDFNTQIEPKGSQTQRRPEEHPHSSPTYQSKLMMSENFNTSPSPWSGSGTSHAALANETSPLSATTRPKTCDDGQGSVFMVSNERRKSINRIAQPWNSEVRQLGGFSSVGLSMSNNCSSMTSPVHPDVLERPVAEKRPIYTENQRSSGIYKDKESAVIAKTDNLLTDLEVSKTSAKRKLRWQSNGTEWKENASHVVDAPSTEYNAKSAETHVGNNSATDYYDYDAIESALPYSTSPKELGEITLTPSMLTKARNGVYPQDVDAQRYVTLAHSNAQLDGGVCSVGVAFAADQLHGLYQSDGVYSDHQQLDKNMLGRQIEHLSNYTSNSKLNDYGSAVTSELTQEHGCEEDTAMVEHYIQVNKESSAVMCRSNESLLSWQDCHSTLDSDDNEGNAYTTAHSMSVDEEITRELMEAEITIQQDESYADVEFNGNGVCSYEDTPSHTDNGDATITYFDDQGSAEWFQHNNEGQRSKGYSMCVLDSPYLDVSRQWSWYPYKENETPGKTTSHRRKKIVLTPCSKHFYKKEITSDESDPFQYGDCEECSEYIRHLKLMIETSTPTDLSSKAFLRKLMEPTLGITTTEYLNNVNPFSAVTNRVAEDLPHFNDPPLFEKNDVISNVDMSGDDAPHKSYMTDFIQPEQEVTFWNRKSDVTTQYQRIGELTAVRKASKSQSYTKIASVIVLDVLLKSIARMVVPVIINRAFQSLRRTVNVVPSKDDNGNYRLDHDSHIPVDYNDLKLDIDKIEPSEDDAGEFASTASSLVSIEEHVEMKSRKIFPSHQRHEDREPSLDREPYSTLPVPSPVAQQTINLDTDVSDQSLPPTRDMFNDHSGLSLSDVTFENLKYMKCQLLAVKQVVQNTREIPNDANDDTSGTSYNILVSGTSDSTIRSQHQTHSETNQPHDWRYGDKILTTCNCCNRYICKLDETLHNADDDTKTNYDPEYLPTELTISSREGHIRNASIITLDDHDDENKSRQLLPSSNLHDHTEDYNTEANFEASSSECYREQTDGTVEFITGGDVEPACIDTKIYVWEKFKDFKPLPKQDVVVASPETPTRERIKYFDGLSSRSKPEDHKSLEYDLGDEIEDDGSSESQDVLPSNNQIDEQEVERMESPGSFTIFQAFFDALYTPLPTDKNKSPVKTNSTEDSTDELLPPSSDHQDGGTNPNEYQEDTEGLKNVYEDSMTIPSGRHEVVEITHIDCVAYSEDSSDCEDEEDEEPVKEIAPITSDDSFQSAQSSQNTSSTAESRDTRNTQTVKKNEKKTRFGFFKRLFTKKNKPKSPKKDTGTDNENETVDEYNVDGGAHSDIEWEEEVSVVENILITDGESNVEDIEVIQTRKPTKKKSSFLTRFRPSKRGSTSEIPGQIDATVSKVDHQTSENTTTVSSGSETKSSPKKRLFSFKDVKRSHNKNGAKSSRHRHK